MIGSLNSSFTTDETSTSKQCPPSIISPQLLESFQGAVYTAEVSGTTPLTPEELKQQRLLFIQQFRERITKTTQQCNSTNLHHPHGTEFMSKLLAETEIEVTMNTAHGNKPNGLPVASSTLNRLSIRSSDRRSPRTDVRVRSLERMSETTSTSNNYLKPPRSNNSNSRRFSGTPYPARRSGNLLKDSFLHVSEAKQSHNDYPNNSYAIADSYTVSEVTADMMNEDYDSDYWEDERLILKWQARRSGLIYFGIEELEKHKQQTVLTTEEKMKLLMR